MSTVRKKRRPGGPSKGPRSFRERIVGTPLHDVLGVWMLVWSYAPAVGMLWVFHRWPSVLTFLGAMLMVGIRMNALFVVVHESWHFNLFRSRKANEWLGSALASYPIVMPYFHNRNAHWDHHRHVGTLRDPDAWAWDWPDAQRRGFVRELLVVATGWSYLLRIKRLVLREPAPPQPEGRPPRPVLAADEAKKEIRRFAVVHLVILVVFWKTIGWVWYFPLWLLPSLSLFPAWRSLREFLEHRRGALMVYESGFIERFLLGCFNFHLHAYHHAHASAPWFTLPVMRERAHAKTPEIVYRPSYFQELFAYLRGTSTVPVTGDLDAMPAGDEPLGDRDEIDAEEVR